jgi:serine phosphatase RsbU (regulator of sigma subunit)
MSAPASGRILVCAAEPADLADVAAALEEAGRHVTHFRLNGATPDDAAAYDLAVLDGRPADAPLFCRRLRGAVSDGFVPILAVGPPDEPSQPFLDSGADAALTRPFGPGDLLAQVEALLRLKGMYNRLVEKSAEVQRINKRLQQAYQQLDQELDLARLVQQSFLPRSLPEMSGARFAVDYRPRGRVGGDFYDVFRLDEHHVGFYVADAMGHGVPAGLLTLYLKGGVRAKEIMGREYRLVPPDEVLGGLNRDLIAHNLAESRFITMAYGLLDTRSATLDLARAGHPQPLYVPAEGQPRLLELRGSLLGVFDTEFPVQRYVLRPGDKVLLYTDGLDAVSPAGQEAGPAGLLAAATRLRGLPVREWVEGITREMQPGEPIDDVTLLGLEVGSVAAIATPT